MTSIRKKNSSRRKEHPSIIPKPQAIFDLAIPVTSFYNRLLVYKFYHFFEKVRIDHHPKGSTNNLNGNGGNDFQHKKNGLQSVPRDPHEVPKWEVASQMAFHTPPVHAALFPGESSSPRLQWKQSSLLPWCLEKLRYKTGSLFLKGPGNDFACSPVSPKQTSWKVG